LIFGQTVKRFNWFLFVLAGGERHCAFDIKRAEAEAAAKLLRLLVCDV